MYNETIATEILLPNGKLYYTGHNSFIACNMEQMGYRCTTVRLKGAAYHNIQVWLNTEGHIVYANGFTLSKAIVATDEEVEYYMPIKAYKLFRLRKNGTLGPLFINKKQVLPLNEWMTAEDHPTKGYAHRPGWHCLMNKEAPHLTTKGRVWALVVITESKEIERPESQGGSWYLANKMKIVHVYND